MIVESRSDEKRETEEECEDSLADIMRKMLKINRNIFITF